MTTLKLYQTHLTLGRNAKVDNIESYLATLQHTDLNIQYQRLGTDITINVPIEQKYVGEAKWNYASITQDDKIYYFFVIGADWQAKNTVALTLSMDTVNTWWDELQWSSKTSISREHQDRFIKGSNYEGLENAGYARKIDKFSEGLEPVLTSRDRDDNFKTWSDIGKGKNWYIVYKTRDDITPDKTINPISVMTLCDESIELAPEKNNPGVYREDHEEWYGKAVYITNTGVPDAKIWLTTGQQIENPDVSLTFPLNDDGSQVRAYKVLSEPLGVCRVYAISYTGDAYPYSFAHIKPVAQTNTDLYDRYIYYENIRIVHKLDENVEFYRNLTALDTIDGVPGERIDAGHIPAERIIGFNDLDRSNSKFTKIVELPYPPCDFIYDDTVGGYQPVGSWTYNVGYQTVESTLNNQEFGSKITSIRLDNQLFQTITKPTGNEDFMPQNESKLYNSEFYKMSMVYGDVSLPIKLERIIPPTSNLNAPEIYPYFSVSNALSSTMLFKADYLHCEYKPEYDKDGCLFSTVSTEKPIFNSSYVDYLRAGYNYDKEALNQQNRMAAINGTINVVGGLIGLGGAGASLAAQHISDRNKLNALTSKREDLNPFLQRAGLRKRTSPGGLSEYVFFNEGENDARSKARKQWQSQLAHAATSLDKQISGFETHSINPLAVSFATQLISGSVNAIGSAYSTIKSIESNNRSFASGMASRQAQAVNALGVSDIDIQSQAVGNALRLTAYKPEPEIAEQLARMFHYMGYNHPVQEVPNFTSRYWFNFVQCEPVFKDEEVSVYSNYLDDIKARFAAGITVYHTHNGVIDWEQEKENWETWFFSPKIQISCGTLNYITSIRRGGYSLNATKIIDNNKYKVELQLDDKTPMVVSFDSGESWVALGNLPTFKSARTRVVSVNKPSENSDWVELALNIKYNI